MLQRLLAIKGKREILCIIAILALIVVVLYSHREEGVRIHGILSEDTFDQYFLEDSDRIVPQEYADWRRLNAKTGDPQKLTAKFVKSRLRWHTIWPWERPRPVLYWHSLFGLKHEGDDTDTKVFDEETELAEEDLLVKAIEEYCVSNNLDFACGRGSMTFDFELRVQSTNSPRIPVLSVISDSTK